MSATKKEKQFNDVLTLNKLNSMSDERKSGMAHLFETALREKIQKEKQGK